MLNKKLAAALFVVPVIISLSVSGFLSAFAGSGMEALRSESTENQLRNKSDRQDTGNSHSAGTSDAGDQEDVSQSQTPPAGLQIVDKPEARLEPGMDVERGPIAYGEQLQRWTTITERERNTPYPFYNWLIGEILAGRADKRIMREYYWFHQRLDPFDREIPRDWRETGIAALKDPMRRRRALEAAAEFNKKTETGMDVLAKAKSRVPDNSNNPSGVSSMSSPGISNSGVWVPIGPKIIPGRMTGLDRPADAPGTLFAGAADGGLWKTTDFGQTWVALTDFEQTLSVGSVLLDPTDPGIIYVGTGEGNGAIDNYPGVSVMKSTDGGKSWSYSNRFTSTVRGMTMHRSNTQKIFATGDSGLWVSNDGGSNFAQVQGGLPTNAGASAVLVHPDDPNIVYCAIWGGNGGGVYRSSDGGTSWTWLQNGIPSGISGRYALAIGRSDPNVLITGIDKDSGEVYRTTNGGDSWVKTNAPTYCGGQCWYDNVVGIDPGNADILYAGGVDTYRSTDGGTNWVRISSSNGNHGTPNFVHVDQHYIFTPAAGEIILANDGGIYRSLDYGDNWTELSQGVETAQYYAMCSHSTYANWSMGGTQDNGTQRYRSFDDPTWKMVMGGDGGMCQIDHAFPDTIAYAEYQNLNMQKTVNAGESWFNINGGIPNNDPHPWIGILVMDPVDSNNLFCGTNRVFRTMDGHATPWAQISGPLFYSLNVSAIAVAPSNHNYLYAGFDGGGIYLSTNALASGPKWTDIRKSNVPYRGIRRIMVHPNNTDIVYILLSGYGNPKIMKSTNKGDAWTDITGDLPDVPVNDMRIDLDNLNTLILATDLGLFRSDDDGAHWYGFSNGLPVAAAIEMTYRRDLGHLRVATHGRGMFDWQEASDTPVAVPDGRIVSGKQMKAEKIGADQMRVSWDVQACTAKGYTLLYGDLPDVEFYAYSGADCDIGNSGLATLPLPLTTSGNAFFVIVANDAGGKEGPHGYDSSGQLRPANGIGFCGITSQDQNAACQ